MKIKLVYSLIVVGLIFSSCISRQTVKVNENPGDKKGPILYSGGAGDSYETAIILKSANRSVKKQDEAVAGEYDYISGLYGKKGKEWIVEEQSMVKENNKVYDMVRVKIVQKEKMHFFYFDITEFSKKLPKQLEQPEQQQNQ